MDELFTFVGSKKRGHVVTLVDRATRCIVAWAVCTSRTPELMQVEGSDADLRHYLAGWRDARVASRAVSTCSGAR